MISTAQSDYVNRSIARPSVEQVLAGTKLSGLHEFNNGAMMAAPGSQFGAAWWAHNERSTGSTWSGDCCRWPPTWERSHPHLLQANPAMRSLTHERFHPNLSWADHVELLGTKGVSSIHLQTARVRSVARAVLERAVLLAGGPRALSPAHLLCVESARSLLRKSKGEHDDNLNWNNVRWG